MIMRSRRALAAARACARPRPTMSQAMRIVTTAKSASHRASAAGIGDNSWPGDRKNPWMTPALTAMLSRAGRNPLNQATAKMAATNGGLGT